MQHKITRPSKLLNEEGELKQRGYATYPILKYLRKDVARKLRLKEWDYYLINNKEYAVALTVAYSVSILMISVSLIDLKKANQTTKTVLRVISNNEKRKFPSLMLNNEKRQTPSLMLNNEKRQTPSLMFNKKFAMPESSETGDILYHDSKINLSFRHINEKRKLNLSILGTKTSPDWEFDLLLSHAPDDSMVIATPFDQSEKMFYYNRKIIGMRALGTARHGDRQISFHPSDSFGLLDWGRGVWPYHTTWYWSAAQGMVCDKSFGFNLGYGFGNTSAATENMLFSNGDASKLKQVSFHIPLNKKRKYEYMKPWRITSSDGSVEMKFTPIFDRSANLWALFLSSNQHQVFGKFTGKAILHDNTVIYLKDFLGFAERVENRW